MADIEITADASEVVRMQRELLNLNRTIAQTATEMDDLTEAGNRNSAEYRDAAQRLKTMRADQYALTQSIKGSKDAILMQEVASRRLTGEQLRAGDAAVEATRDMQAERNSVMALLGTQEGLTATLMQQAAAYDVAEAAAMRYALAQRQVQIAAAQSKTAEDMNAARSERMAIEDPEDDRARELDAELARLRDQYRALGEEADRVAVAMQGLRVEQAELMRRTKELVAEEKALESALKAQFGTYQKAFIAAERLREATEDYRIANDRLATALREYGAESAATAIRAKELAAAEARMETAAQASAAAAEKQATAMQRVADAQARVTATLGQDRTAEIMRRNAQATDDWVESMRRADAAQENLVAQRTAGQANFVAPDAADVARRRELAAAEKELYDARLRGNVALRDSIDAQTAAYHAAQNAAKAKTILLEAERKFGEESRAALAAQRQYDRMLTALNTALHKQAQAEAVAESAMHDRMSLMVRTTLTMEQQDKVIADADAAYNRFNTTLGITSNRYEELRQTALAAGHAIEKTAVHEVGAGGFGSTVTDFSKDASIYTRGVGLLDASLGKLVTTVSIAHAQMASLVAVFGLWRVTTIIQELDRMDAAMQAAFKSTTEITQAQQELLEISGKYGERAKDLYRSYILLTSAASAQGIALRDINAAFEGVTAASVVFGQSQEDVKASLVALSQIAAKGVVSMEEMRQQLGERLPTALALTARGLNMTTVALIEEISRGNVSAKEFFDVFGEEMMKEYGQAAQAVDSISKALGQLGQAFDSLVKTMMDAGLADVIKDSVRGLIDILQSDSTQTAALSFVAMFEGVSSAVGAVISLVEALGGLSTVLGVLTTLGVAFLGKFIVPAAAYMIGLVAQAATLTVSLKAMKDGFLAARTAMLAFSTASMFNPILLAIGAAVAAVALLAGALRNDVPSASDQAAAAVQENARIINNVLMTTANLQQAIAANTAQQTATSEQTLRNAENAAKRATLEGQAQVELIDSIGKQLDAQVADARRREAEIRNQMQETQARLTTQVQTPAGPQQIANPTIDSQTATLLEYTLEGLSNQLVVAQAETNRLRQELAALRAEGQKAQTAVAGANLLEAQKVKFRELTDAVINIRREFGTLGVDAAIAADAIGDKWGKAASKAGVDAAQMQVIYAGAAASLTAYGVVLQGTAEEQTAFLDAFSKSGSVMDGIAALFALATERANETKAALTGFTASLTDLNQVALSVNLGGLDKYEEVTKMQESVQAVVSDFDNIARAAGLSAAETAALKGQLGQSSQAAHDLIFNVNNVQSGLSSSSQLALDMMRGMYDAAQGADAAAAAAAGITDAIASAVSMAQQLRAVLNAGAVNIASFAKQAQDLVAQRAALAEGGLEGLAAVQRGQGREEAISRATAESVAAQAEAQAEINKLRESGAATSTEGLRELVKQEDALDRLIADQATLARLAGEAYDQRVALNDEMEAAREAAKGGGGGGASAGEKAEARDLTAALALLKKATKEARGETGQMNSEAARLFDAMAMVNAAVKAGTLDLGNLDINMALVKERITQLLYGVRDFGDVVQDEFISALGSAGDALTDLFTGGIESAQDFADQMESIFSDMMKNLLRTIIENEIIVPIKMGLDGNVGEGAGLLSSLGGAFATGFKGVLGGFGDGGFTGAVAGATEAVSAASGAFETVAAAAGAALPILGAVSFVMSALKTTTTVNFAGIRIMVTETGAEVDHVTKVTKSKLFGLIKSSETTVKSAGKAGEAISASLGEMFESVRKSGEVLGIASGQFDGFAQAIDRIRKINLKGMSSDERQTKIENVLNSIASQMVRFGTDAAGMTKALKEVRQEGESLFETFTALAQSLGAVNDALAGMRMVELPASVQGGAAARALSDLFGGVDQFLSATSNYSDIFLSDAEKVTQQRILLDRQAERLNKTYEDLNLTVPKSAKELRRMVEGLDLMTEEGRAVYAFLVGNADAFKDIFDSMGEGFRTLQDQIDALTERRSDIMAELVNRYDALIAAEKNLADVRAGLLTSDLAPGTEMSQLAAIRKQFETAARRGAGGDAEAATQAGQLAQQLLQQGRVVYASSTAYADLFRQVNEMLMQAQEGVKGSAATLKPQLDAETFRDVSRQSTAALLKALARIEEKLADLNDTQKGAEDKAAKNAQRRRTGTGG